MRMIYLPSSTGVFWVWASSGSLIRRNYASAKAEQRSGGKKKKKVEETNRKKRSRRGKAKQRVN